MCRDGTSNGGSSTAADYNVCHYNAAADLTNIYKDDPKPCTICNDASTYRTGRDLNGNDLTSAESVTAAGVAIKRGETATSAAACCARCTDDVSACLYWTWNNENTRCYLKSASSGDKSDAVAISGNTCQGSTAVSANNICSTALFDSADAYVEILFICF